MYEAACLNADRAKATIEFIKVAEKYPQDRSDKTKKADMLDKRRLYNNIKCEATLLHKQLLQSISLLSQS